MANDRLQKWALTAEVIGGIAVVISLVFVGIELRSNTEATRAATREAINQKDIDFLSLRLDSSVIAQAMTKVEAGEPLSPLEESQLVSQQYVNFMIFEHTYYQYSEGVLDENDWARHENIARQNMHNNSYAQRMWQKNQDTFTSGFKEVIEGLKK